MCTHAHMRVYMCVGVHVYAPTCACVCVALYTVLSGGGGGCSHYPRDFTHLYIGRTMMCISTSN